MKTLTTYIFVIQFNIHNTTKLTNAAPNLK